MNAPAPELEFVDTLNVDTARKVAERVIMLYPLSRLGPGEPQIVFDGSPEELDRASDRRVRQFVRGEAGERLMEMREQAGFARNQFEEDVINFDAVQRR